MVHHVACKLYSARRTNGAPMDTLQAVSMGLCAARYMHHFQGAKVLASNAVQFAVYPPERPKHGFSAVCATYNDDLIAGRWRSVYAYGDCPFRGRTGCTNGAPRIFKIGRYSRGRSCIRVHLGARQSCAKVDNVCCVMVRHLVRRGCSISAIVVHHYGAPFDVYSAPNL